MTRKSMIPNTTMSIIPTTQVAIPTISISPEEEIPSFGLPNFSLDNKVTSIVKLAASDTVSERAQIVIFVTNSSPTILSIVEGGTSK